MKKTTFTLLLSLSCCWLAAQCPTDITFSTQGQVDSFQINYPGCTDIPGSVSISGYDITNLQGLSVLDSVKGSLSISENPVLTGLSGLENLKYVGIGGVSGQIDVTNQFGLTIFTNPMLTYLHGLKRLTYVAGCLDIRSNDALTSLSGLDSLSFVGDCKYSNGSPYSSNYRSVNISGNGSLKSLTGLDNLHYLSGRLDIHYNDSLTTLTGLDNLDSLGARGSLEITGNPVLVSLDALVGLQHIGQCIYSAQNRVNMRVSENPLLTSIQGLDKVSFDPPARIEIISCPALSVCGIQSICQHLKNGGWAWVSDNAPGCNSVPEIEAACIVSIEETSTGLPVVIFYPNPASDFLQIQVSDNEQWEISLFDLRGRLLYQRSASDSQTVSLRDWPAGLYTLRAVSGGRVFAGKIVKQ